MPRTMNEAGAGYTVSDGFECLENLRRTSSELYTVYCGWERNKPLQSYQNAPRKNHVLHFVLSGKGTFTFEGNTWNLSRGDVFYIPPGMRADYAADETDPWIYAWIGCNGVRAEELIALAGFSADAPVRKSSSIEQIHELVNGILRTREPLASNEVLRASRMMELFAVLIREKEELVEQGGISPEEPDFVLYAIKYISQNFDKNIRIQTLASELGVSRSYLSSCFRKATGCSPQNFILNLRMERAGSLLRTTTLPVNIISGAVGYQDQLAFSKIFKQFYGVSPRDYRKSGKEIKVFSKKGEFDHSNL